MIRASLTKFKKSLPNNVITRTRIIPMNVKLGQRDSRNFCVSSARNSSIKLSVDSNNIHRSQFKDIEGVNGVYLHDYVWKNLDKWADKTALVCTATGRNYTYAQTRKAAGRLATSLRKLKLRPGDTIAVILPNIPETAIVLFGASEAGIRLIPMSPRFSVHEISTQLKNSNASAVITTSSKCPIVERSVIDNRAIRLPIIIVEDGSGAVPEGVIKFGDLMREDIEEFEKTGEETGTHTEDTFLMLLSSGSTGFPKLVQLSHRNIVANLKQLATEGVADTIEASTNWQDTVPIFLPLYHIYGLTVCLNLYMTQGAKLMCVPEFNADTFFKILKVNRPTLLAVTPAVVQLIVNDRRSTKSHFETIRTIVSGAAPIGVEVLTKYQKLTSAHTNLMQSYGLTECSPAIAMSMKSPFASTGRLIPNTDVRIVGHEAENRGKNLSFDQVGEIYARGPQVMKGYYNNPDATANSMEGDWFKTGDLGSIDENGNLYIRGRLKELIKVQGYSVAPAEIEHLIQEHEKVADAAVIGVPHEKYGEVPKAFVVRKNGVKLEPDEIKHWVAERLIKYKRLGHVQFIDEIPKSPAGKILRRELEKM